MNRLLKESQNLHHLLANKEEVVFYAESKNYYPDFEGLVKELGYSSYITSDSNDPILQKPGTYYLNKLLSIYMRFANCRILTMTMTDLNQSYIKQSVNPVHYVYIFHSLVSTHMVYRFGAFDYYNSILCAGPHQVSEIRRCEKLYNLKPKNLIEAGYYKLEKLYNNYQEYSKKTKEINILVAPTWGPVNLLEVCGESLIRTLLPPYNDYRVTLRLHPETIKQGKWKSCDGIKVETSVVNIESLMESDILITDWSGIGLEYAFGTERPVIFINTTPKIRNSKYTDLEIEPIESYLRSDIGVIVSPDDIDSISSVIDHLLNNRKVYRGKLAELRNKYVFNFGTSSEVSADYIRSIL